MNKVVLLSFTVIVTVLSFSQNRLTNWHFGNSSKGLWFDQNNSYSVSVTNTSYTPYGWAGNTVVSADDTGELLFYSDGAVVVDATHNVMPNGSGLMGEGATFNAGYACMYPGDCNKWYLFSISTETAMNALGNLYYSVVDMTLPGNGTAGSPLGDIILGEKNVLVASNISEDLEIIAKPNSHDYWLVITHNDNSNVELYEITNAGVNFVCSQYLGATLTDIQGTRYNEQNGKFAFTSLVEAEPIVMLDFDAVNGIFSNATTLLGTPMGNSTLPWTGMSDVEFSPDGSKMYISKLRGGIPSSGGKLYQYDFNNPLAPPILIYDMGSSTSKVSLGLETGPDGKIYLIHVNTNGQKRYFSYINSPNLPGSLCNFVAEGIDMGQNLGTAANFFPRFYEMINSIPTITDSTINYPITIPGLVTVDILSNYIDDEGDSLSMSVLNATNGNAIINGTQVEITVSEGCAPSTVTVSYCDDFCYSKCDTFDILLIPYESPIALITVTECQSYTVPSGDETYNVSGIYMDTIQNYLGCDSLINIDLTIKAIPASISVLECNSYIVPSGDETYFVSGSYTDTIPNYYGCDSLIFIDLIIGSSVSNINVTSCDQYTVPSGDETYFVSGSYTDTIPNYYGCDSLITIDLLINQSETSNLSVIECYQYTVPSGDETYYSSGTYTDTLSTDNECDSLLIINLTLVGTTTSTIFENSCSSYTVPSGDETYFSSGIYSDTIASFIGCDSIITINLSILNSYDTLVITSCDSYTVPSGDETYYASGIYLDTIQNYAGCDSMLYIDLTIGNSASEIDEFTCDRYTVPSGNATYSQSGQYMDTLQSVSGCDSILIINLTVYVLDTVVSQIADTLHANMDSVSYQWISCVSGLALTSETNQNFVPVSNGYYAVVVTTDEGCSDTSGCYTIGNVEIKEDLESGLKIYPNPSSDQFTIEAEGQFYLEVRAVTGKLLFHQQFVNKTVIDLSDQSKGIYILTIKNEFGIKTERIVLE